MNASFEEKSSWIQLISLLVALTIYAQTAVEMMNAGVTALPAYAAVFGGSIVLLVVVIVAGHIVLAIASRDHGKDERDRQIAWRAESNTSWILGVGVVTAIGAMTISVEPLWVAHGLLFSLYLAEVANLLLRIVYYRRGIWA